MRKVYLEPAWKLHSLYREFISHPPEGYEFITPHTFSQELLVSLGKSSFVQASLKWKALDPIAPLRLIKAYTEKFKKIPPGTDLTYACNHLVFRDEPWIVDVEFVSCLLGHKRHLKRYKGIIERAFASDYCKRIICWTEMAEKSILSNLDCEQFEHKIETVYLAVHEKEFVKSYNENKLKLLLVGSANIPGQFELKGGREALEAFTHLNQRYNNLELVIRSDIPGAIKNRYKDFNNIRIIDNTISQEELEQEFKSADIFVFPSYMTPGMAILEAMSYELPVITTDVWANPELIENGNTGFLVKKSEQVQWYSQPFIPDGRPTQTTDPKVVQELVEKTSILIENEELKRRMGRAARWEVEHGKFSIKRRNEILKRIFDEATEGR